MAHGFPALAAHPEAEYALRGWRMGTQNGPRRQVHLHLHLHLHMLLLLLLLLVQARPVAE